LNNEACQSFQTENGLCETMSFLNKLLKKIDHAANEARNFIF